MCIYGICIQCLFVRAERARARTHKPWVAAASFRNAYARNGRAGSLPYMFFVCSFTLAFECVHVSTLECREMRLLVVCVRVRV